MKVDGNLISRNANSKLWFKFLTGILMPVVLVFLLATMLITSSVGKSVENISVQKLNIDSQLISSKIGEFFTFYVSATETGASSSQVVDIIAQTKKGERMEKSPLFKSLNQTLTNTTDIDPENILYTWIAGFESSELVSSSGFISDSTFDVTTRPWYQVKNTKKTYISPPYIDTETGDTVISIVSPVFNGNKTEVIGVFAFDINLAQITKIMSNYKIGDHGFTMLADPEGKIIYHPNEKYIEKNISDIELSKELTETIQKREAMHIDYKMDGKTYIGDIAVEAKSGWTLITGEPEKDVMAAKTKTSGIIFIVFGLGLALIVLSVLFIARNITNAMKKLSSAALDIAEGNLDVKIEVNSNDEIGDVAVAMNKTTDRLNSYVDYIAEVEEVLNSIASGSLDFQLHHDYAGEFAKIKEALLNIRETLRDTIINIKESSEQVSLNSRQISMGAQFLADGTTEQAGAIEELSATVGDISSKISDMAKHSVDVNTSIEHAGEKIELSNRQMQDMLEAMNEINEKSAQIGKIIKTIDDIAFQTNILALNAAVEAARSGAAGKGFAVVADEVRNLANKSAEAAKVSDGFITEAIVAVERGSRLVNEAAENLEVLYDNSRNMLEGVAMISQSTQAQAVAVNQVNEGLEQIAHVIHTNSATAEESAASTRELSAQAEILDELVKKFDL